MSDCVEAWRERVQAASASRSPLRIVGGASKDFYGLELVGEPFATRDHAGIVDHDPTELVITARCGTPLAEVERALASEQQMLAFEPPYFGGAPTVGGCVAAGLSGPRRVAGGAVRDLVLGTRVLDGNGQVLSFGGRVMKNVAGFDVSRLMAGAMGTLGILLDVSLKCVPRPRVEQTVELDLGVADALARLAEWSPQPLPVSAVCWHDGLLRVRLSGAQAAVAAARKRIGGQPCADAEAFWPAVRDHHHPFFAGGASLWRASVRATAPQPAVAAPTLIEWNGALRWFQVEDSSEGEVIRRWAIAQGGHATLFRAEFKFGHAFQPLPAPMLSLHRRLKAAFDPAGIFNPRRMYAEF